MAAGGLPQPRAGGSRCVAAKSCTRSATGRQDPNPDVRRAALAAAARLGECAALQMIREMLAREYDGPGRGRGPAVRDRRPVVALAGTRRADRVGRCMVAAEAWEAIERLREEFLGPLG